MPPRTSKREEMEKLRGNIKEFQEKLGSWLAMTVSAYAPFVDPTTGQLDWMEESPYG